MPSAMANEAPFDPCASEQVAAYVRGLPGGADALTTRIHPADEMYRYELGQPLASRETAAVLYFSTASQIFRALAEVVAWRFGGFGAVGSLLDFASGYGRTTRFLVQALGGKKITVAEIDPGAVRFQQETFGVRGIVTGPDPASLRIGDVFDAVFAVSFFSHLPAGRFEDWLERLYARVAPGGILVFSVHGMDLLPGLEMDRTTGIVFRAVSETTRLDGAEYGTSHVTSEFVRGAVGRATGGEARLLAFPLGLTGFQDLYVLLRPPVPALPELLLARYPWGALEHAAIRSGVVEAEGWARGYADERPPDMRLVLAGRVAEASPGQGAAGSRRRWRFQFPADSVDPDAIVRIEAESARGLSRILVAATLRPHLPAPGA